MLDSIKRCRNMASAMLILNRSKDLFLLATCILLLVTVFTGCAGKKEIVKPQPAKDYSDILSQWTKSKKVYENLETKLYIYATYKSWQWRDAYIDEYAKRYMMDALQKENILAREKEINERFNEFFLSIYTPEIKWNDFDKKDSIWSIYLEDDKGERVSPLEITRVDENNPLVREFFPHMDLWSFGYIVRFPKYLPTGKEPFPSSASKSMKLIITGAVGKTQLEWRLIQ
ncbi:MAG: hypothetical protein HZB79_08505 [Deltaproteobacteria bacterium]|nr:hypothetical protein [Deltaproteobacteria bacterium]